MNAALKAFLILVQVLSTSAMHLSLSFSLSLGYPIEENHGSCCIRIFVLIQSKVDLYGHEPSVGISSLSAELFREGCFDFHVVIFFVGKRIYVDGGARGIRGEESGELGGDWMAGGTGRSKYCIQVRSPNGVVDCKWRPLEEVGGGQKGK